MRSSATVLFVLGMVGLSYLPSTRAGLLGELLCVCNDGYVCGLLTGCIACPAGTTNTADWSSCVACPANTWSGEGSTCQPCPAGTASDAGSSSCRSCPAGSFSKEGQGCEECPTNTGSSEGSASCTAQCPAGSYLVDSSDPTPTCGTCPPGSVAEAGSNTCESCRVGTAPDATQATCMPTSTAGMRRRSRGQLCPVGFQLCPVGRRGTLECVETASSLTHCGGCPGAGEDCSARYPNAIAQCDRGKCRYGCPAMFQLTEAGCKRIRRS